MKLKNLFKDLPGILIKGCKDTEVNGVVANSKLVAPGNLFVAKRGMRSDGHLFIQEAMDNGAVAVLSDIFNPFHNKIAQVICSDVAAIMGLVAARFYGHPSRRLLTIGVTGTNGKTSVSFMIKHLLDSIQMPCGLIGTIEYIVGQTRYPASHTTPDACSVQRLLREMELAELKACVMEVSSHALDQKRVDDVAFDAAIFTNLHWEHLDYHKTMESYAQAKARLFALLSACEAKPQDHKAAIVNIDCPWSKKMLTDCTTPLLTYGFSKKADLVAQDVALSATHTTFSVVYKNEKTSFVLPLIGRFNVLNALAVVALGVYLKLSMTDLSRILQTAPLPEGRLQRVENTADLHIFVDYAHKPDALRHVLQTLKQVKRGGRIITVFGCGGNRDVQKRPLMAKVSEEYSDLTIVTSDNPRDEDPSDICRQIVEGFSKDAYYVDIDREKAIERAIKAAEKEDIILIAGKGHETQQIFKNYTLPFDDRICAAALCKTYRK